MTMRASLLSLTAPLVVALVPPTTASAQSSAPSASLMTATSPITAAREADPYVVTMAPIAPAAAPRAADDGSGQSTAGRVFRAAVGVGVGAAVGGWLGYFGAQVANGDWARISSAEKTNLRQGYTKVGIGVGGVTGGVVGGVRGVVGVPQRTGTVRKVYRKKHRMHTRHR